ncbi:hypothetical protein [Reinekea sp. G2M2-21]|uniref:hypothetical protein n=1 Tax=Reinekea sp. G2M2-21 TaxID=2788942 RepID=UPI0018AB7B45|nr:hypothetical protein [Reinekea sp. G2M2-21]
MTDNQSGRQKGVQGDLPFERKIFQKDLLVENGTIVFGTDLELELRKFSVTKLRIDKNYIEQLKSVPFEIPPWE